MDRGDALAYRGARPVYAFVAAGEGLDPAPFGNRRPQIVDQAPVAEHLRRVRASMDSRTRTGAEFARATAWRLACMESP